MDKRAQTVEKKPLGVFESLSSGFELIWLNPWILLVPIALDVFLWIGPHLSARPVFQRMVTLVTLAAPAHAPEETRQNIELLKSMLQAAGDTLNVFSVLATGMPSVLGWQAPAVTISRAEFVISEPITLLAVTLVLLIGAALIAALYLELTARPIRREPVTASFIARWLRACVNLILLALLVIVGISAVMIPLTIVAGMLSVVSQVLGSLLLFGGMILMFWILVYLVFAVSAIFISRANALRAIINSIRVFRFDFLSALGLVLIVYVLRSGFTIVWDFFDTNLWGIVFVVIANAFFNSALIAAEMIFYKDRIERMG
ncbi:MAG: hypothetical protein N2559_16010 [Anaerolineae bacterium]|nr:hypothetical protein [Anaerolineae bacterium]